MWQYLIHLYTFAKQKYDPWMKPGSIYSFFYSSQTFLQRSILDIPFYSLINQKILAIDITQFLSINDYVKISGTENETFQI